MTKSELHIQLGWYIRAARLRYHHVRNDFFLRISSESFGLLKCELQPIGLVPLPRGRGSRKNEKLYYLWWEGTGYNTITNHKPFKFIHRVKKPITFLINNEGEIVDA